MKKLHFTFLVVSILLMGGCQLDFWESSGRMPKLDRTDTLSGVDANNDGVRDDIEKWIKKRWEKEPLKQKALLQYAKVAQKSVMVDLNNQEEIEKIDELGMRAINCLFDRFADDDIHSEQNPSNVRKEIRAYTTNTKERLTHYLAYNEKLDGTTSRLPEGDTCDE